MNNKSIYFIYETINCTPNGDPDNGEQRYNEALKRAVVSDLRIKRFGRDKLNEIGVPIFYYYDKESIIVDDKKVSGAAARFKQFCKENNINVDKNANDIILKNFVDVRIFGGVLTSKTDNCHITGALQFDAENNSINEIIMGENLINRGITTVFPSNDEKGQGSMGRDSFLRYGLFCIKGRLNATTAKYNGVSENDIKLTLTSIWEGMKNITTRSKYGHEPIACIVIDHPTKEVKNGFLGSTLSKSFIPFLIKPASDLSNIYKRTDFNFDFSPLDEISKSEMVEKITIYCDDDLFSGIFFKDLPKTTIVNPFTELLNLI